MSYLSDVCAELRTSLEGLGAEDASRDRADAGLADCTAFTAERDTGTGFIRGAHQDSRIPGNIAAMMVALEAHEFVRRLEASLRLAVTGRTGHRRGGSDANTKAALAAIVNLGEAVHEDAAADAARLLERFITLIGQLPAVDTVPRWERIRPGPGGLPPKCPWCETFSLRVAICSGQVLCVFPGCADEIGNSPPRGRLDLSRVTGSPVLVWDSGRVDYPLAG